MKDKGGRPTVFTEDVISKLEYMFSIGATDKDACVQAGISVDALYKYQQKNKKFLQRKEMLKDRLIMKARETLVRNMHKQPVAMWYLERKRKDEFRESKELAYDPIKEMSKINEVIDNATK